MLTLASQTFANGAWTLTPEEPATLQLALVGFGVLVTYAVLTGWRPARTTVAARLPATGEEQLGSDATRRAA